MSATATQQLGALRAEVYERSKNSKAVQKAEVEQLKPDEEAVLGALSISPSSSDPTVP